MFQSYVPYGSQQLPPGHSIDFAVPWLEELAIEGDAFDVEHRGVLQKLNNLLLVLDSGDPLRIASGYAALAAAARTHFAKEGELMRAVDYPDSASHVAQHEELMRGLVGIQIALNSGNGGWSPANAPSMLEQWFVPHLTHADRRLADFIASHRTAPLAA